MKKLFKVLSVFVVAVVFAVSMLTGCGEKKETVVIFTSAEDYRIEALREKLETQFPDYEIKIEYMSTGNHAAKLLNEGTDTTCDITYDLEYPYLEKLASAGYLADVSEINKEEFLDGVLVSPYYVPDLRNGGAVIIDKEALLSKNIPVPTSYEELTKPEYKGLICMPNPKASGTGFMFLKSLCVAWGEEKALDYFDRLSENVLEFSSSGSGPINRLIQKEVAVGFGMTSQAVNANKEGAKLEIVFFEEGSPYSMYGQGIIKGKDERPAVKAVFDYMVNTFNRYHNDNLGPEQIFASGSGSVEGFPQNIKYCDMGENTPEAKDALLAKWKY